MILDPHLLAKLLNAVPSIVAGTALAALVAVAALTDRRSTLAALALIVLGVVWFLVNQPVEGATILRISTGRGVTTADLAGFAAIASAGVRLWAIWRAGRHKRSANDAGRR